MADPFAPRSMKRRNVKGLALAPSAPKPPTPVNNRRGSNAGDEKSAQLEIGIEYTLNLKAEDLEIVKELGSGNGGTVSKVRHISTGTIMARKVCSLRNGTTQRFGTATNSLHFAKIIHVEAKKELRKRIVRELQIMHGCQSDYIVKFYGAFLNENNDVIMCMECMDVG